MTRVDPEMFLDYKTFKIEILAKFGHFLPFFLIFSKIGEKTSIFTLDPKCKLLVEGVAGSFRGCKFRTQLLKVHKKPVKFCFGGIFDFLVESRRLVFLTDIPVLCATFVISVILCTNCNYGQKPPNRPQFCFVPNFSKP